MSKKTYFASDFHLGIDARLASREREIQICRWLEYIRHDADALYLVGDVFDYFFEYKRVIPKGFSRIMGKLAELRDANLPIYFFTGNHDMWMFRYFEDEMGIPIYRQPIIREIQGKTFWIGHGDGVGPGDYGYKFIKTVFANRSCQWLFERLHPNFGLNLMLRSSGVSRKSQPPTLGWQGADKERIVIFAEAESTQQPHIDYFVCGHRHLPIDYTLRNGHSRYINLGEWMNLNSFGVFDGQDMTLDFFEMPKVDYGYK
jgi:UDP-2,3-diacylglucosamine hydrolase